MDQKNLQALIEEFKELFVFDNPMSFDNSTKQVIVSFKSEDKYKYVRSLFDIISHETDKNKSKSKSQPGQQPKASEPKDKKEKKI